MGGERKKAHDVLGQKKTASEKDGWDMATRKTKRRRKREGLRGHETNEREKFLGHKGTN